MRQSSGDVLVPLIPHRVLSLEQALEFCRDDECVEVTPGFVRLRKVLLRHAGPREAARPRQALVLTPVPRSHFDPLMVADPRARLTGRSSRVEVERQKGPAAIVGRIARRAAAGERVPATGLPPMRSPRGRPRPQRTTIRPSPRGAPGAASPRSDGACVVVVVLQHAVGFAGHAEPVPVEVERGRQDAVQVARSRSVGRAGGMRYRRIFSRLSDSSGDSLRRSRSCDRSRARAHAGPAHAVVERRLEQRRASVSAAVQCVVERLRRPSSTPCSRARSMTVRAMRERTDAAPTGKRRAAARRAMHVCTPRSRRRIAARR